MINSLHFLHSPIITPNPPLSKSLSPRSNPNISVTTPSASFSSASATAEAETNIRSFYEVLGVPMGASSEEVKAAYRKLARVCHPDVAEKDTSAEEFMMIHAAYSTLLDPEKRTDYDRSLFQIRRRFTTLRASSDSPVYTRRNWDTDQCW